MDSSEECVRRWQSESGRVKAREILRMLLEKRISELNEICGAHNQRHDMRGYAFPEPASSNKSLDFGGLGVTPHFGILEFKNMMFDGFDFSYADMNHTVWTRCTFQNCVADHASFSDARFHASSFIDSHFIDCDFSDSLLAGRVFNDSGSLRGTVFSGGRFSDVVFESPEIRDCRFECDLRNIDFDGSQFMQCKFSGQLDKVTFRKRTKDSGRLRKIVSPVNRMRDIDFSQAVFIDVDFRGGLELDGCIMPIKGDIMLITDAPKTFQTARSMISSEWNGEDRRVTLSYIEMFLDDLKNGGQEHFALNGDMLRDAWGHKLAERFVSLVKNAKSSDL